jgi:hypothetical protein
MGPLAWTKLIFQNRRTIYGLVREGLATWRGLPAPAVQPAA